MVQTLYQRLILGAPGPCRDRGHAYLLPVHLHLAVEEERQIVLGQIEDAPLSFDEITDEAEVDRVELVTLVERSGSKVFGERLAWFRIFRQPVVGPRGSQR